MVGKMREYSYKIMPYELDMYGNLPPSGIIKLCVDATRRRGEDDGLPAKRVLELTGGVWMIARLSVKQAKHIRALDEIIFRVHDVGTDRFTIIRNIDLLRNGETIAVARLCYIVVSPEERKILRPEAIAGLWEFASAPSPSEGISRIRVRGELLPMLETSVRYSECDINGHFNSAKYADLICEGAGFGHKESLMSALQIDYSSEFLPGEKILIFGDKSSGIIKGEHADKTVGFTARVSF
jgi:acyl-ACP thioesterase